MRKKDQAINKECDQERVPWINYARDFMEDHPGVPEEFYGRWARILKEEEASGKLTKTTKVNTKRPLNKNEETDRQDEGTPEQDRSEENASDEMGEDEGEFVSNYTHEQIKQSQRICQLGGMPEETIEMLGTLIKTKQKPGERTQLRKQQDKEFTGSNAKPLGAKRTEENRDENGTRTDGMPSIKSNEPEPSKNRRNGGGRKGKTYI